MPSNPDILITLPVALLAGYIGRRLRIPGGALLCATVAVALLTNIVGLSHLAPTDVRFPMQVLIGSILGQSISRHFWQDLQHAWQPAALVVGTFTLMAVPFAILLMRLQGFDALTALLAATPARMQDMILLAEATDRSAVTIMLMQLIRQLCIIGMTPFILKGQLRPKNAAPTPSAAPVNTVDPANTDDLQSAGPSSTAAPANISGNTTTLAPAATATSQQQTTEQPATPTQPATQAATPNESTVPVKPSSSAKPAAGRPLLQDYAFLLVPALVGATVGLFFRHPLGPLLGAFMLVGLARLLFRRAERISFPPFLSYLTQSLAGLLMGVRVPADVGTLMLEHLLPLGLGVIYILGTGLLLCRLLQWRFAWSRALSWISASPGRTSDMLAISQDMDISSRDRVALVSVHAVRQIFFTLLLSVAARFFEA